MLVETKRFASGKYEIYIDGERKPAVIVGGNRKFNLEHRGEFRGQFKSVKEAAERYMEMHLCHECCARLSDKQVDRWDSICVRCNDRIEDEQERGFKDDN